MTDEDFMRLAIDKARDGMRLGQTPFAAAIVKAGELISCAHNIVWATTDITAHAEVTAIREACAALGDVDLSGSTIYSTCEPCPMCFAACHWARIERVVYGADIRDAKVAGFNELPLSNSQFKDLTRIQVEIVPGVLAKEARQLFEEFTKSPQGRKY